MTPFPQIDHDEGTNPVHAELQYHGTPFIAPLSQTSPVSMIPFPQMGHAESTGVGA
jgi:hypothetical protein